MAEIEQPSADERNFAVITHLAGTVFFFIPALIIWALKKNESSYIADQAKEALNFQITVMIAMMVAQALIWVLIGLALIPMVWIGNIILCILAAIATSKGETYRYPLNLRLIS